MYDSRGGGKLKAVKLINSMAVYERSDIMPQTIENLMEQYLNELRKIYGSHLKTVILYGSYARGDYTSDSDLKSKRCTTEEIFPRELGRKIVKAEEIRHASDYDTFYIASKEVTAQQIETARKLLELAEKYLLQAIQDLKSC